MIHYYKTIVIWSLIGIVVIYFLLKYLAISSSSRKLRWVRRWFWKSVRSSMLDAIGAKANPIAAYPATMFLTFNPKPKEVFIREGMESLKVVLTDECNKIIEHYKNPLTPKESYPTEENGLTKEESKIIDDYMNEMRNQ